MHTLRILVAATILGAGLLTGGAAGATTEADCTARGTGAIAAQSYTLGDLTVDSLAELTGKMNVGDVITYRFTPVPGCGLTSAGIVDHATGSLHFDEDEVQPHVAETKGLSGAHTISASTIAGMCRVQLDAVVRSNGDGTIGLPFVTRLQRYNEPLIDHDFDGTPDKKGVYRLLSAGYAEGECVTPPATPEPTTTTSTVPVTTTSTTPAPTTSTTPTTSAPTTSTTADLPPADSTPTTAGEDTPRKIEVRDPLPPDCATVEPGVPCVTTEVTLTPNPSTSTSTTAPSTSTTETDDDDTDQLLPFTGSNTGGLVRLAAALALGGVASLGAAFGLRRTRHA